MPNWITCASLSLCSDGRTARGHKPPALAAAVLPHGEEDCAGEYRPCHATFHVGRGGRPYEARRVPYADTPGCGGGDALPWGTRTRACLSGVSWDQTRASQPSVPRLL